MTKKKKVTTEADYNCQLPKRVFNLEDLETNVLGFRNCRVVSSDTSLKGLSADIRSGKLLDDPIVWVVENDGGDRVVILAGHRRVEAIKRERQRLIQEEGGTGGWFDTIRCSIFDGNLDDAIALNIRENLQREDLNPADEFEAISRMYERVKESDDSSSPQTRVANMLNVSQPTVSNAINTYFGLCAEAFEALRHGNINKTQARKLARMLREDKTPDTDAQTAWLEGYLTSDDSKEPEIKKKSTRTKTYRSKSEVEELRQVLAKSDDLGLDGDHRASLMQFIRWYFCELESDDMLYRVEDTDELAIEPTTEAPKKTKKRIRVGE